MREEPAEIREKLTHVCIYIYLYLYAYKLLTVF